MAESAGIIPRDYRVFWMGHKGDVEAIYSTNKNKLPPELIEDMRSRYGRASMLLTLPQKQRQEGKQKVVTVEELDGYLERGWEYVATLPDSRVVVRRG